MALKAPKKDDWASIDTGLRRPEENTWRLAEILCEYEDDNQAAANALAWYEGLHEGHEGPMGVEMSPEQQAVDGDIWWELTQSPLVEVLSDSGTIIVHQYSTWRQLEGDCEEAQYTGQGAYANVEWLLENYTTVPYETVPLGFLGGEDVTASVVFERTILAMATEHTEHFLSDLFWTARQMPEGYNSGDVFYVGIRAWGVDYSDNLAHFAAAMRITTSNENRYFRAQVYKESRENGGEWTVEVTEVVAR